MPRAARGARLMALLTLLASTCAGAALAQPAPRTLALLFAAEVPPACEGRCTLHATLAGCGSGRDGAPAAVGTPLLGWNTALLLPAPERMHHELALSVECTPANTSGSAAAGLAEPTCTVAPPQRLAAWRGEACAAPPAGSASLPRPLMQRLGDAANDTAGAVAQLLHRGHPMFTVRWEHPPAAPPAPHHAAAAAPNCPELLDPAAAGTPATDAGPATAAARPPALVVVLLRGGLLAWTVGCWVLGRRLLAT